MNIFETRTMLDMVKSAEFMPTSFLRDRYFGNIVTFDTLKVDVDIVDATGRKLAPFVNPKIGGKIVERQGYKTNTYEAPEVSPLMVTTAEDLLKRLPGESVYGAISPEERAARQLGADLRELDERITRREEAMCAEALFDGRVTVKGDGYDEVINYAIEDADATKSVVWSAEDADIISDLRKLRREVVQKCGITPTEIICGADVIEALLKNKAVREMLDTNNFAVGAMKIQDQAQGVTYYGHLGGIDIYGYDAWYFDDEAGVEKPFVPADKFLLGSPAVKTTMAYGCVALAGDDAMAFYEERRVPDSWVQRANPSGRVVQIKARPLPIVNQPLGFRVVTVG